MPKNILILGENGYLGSKILEHLKNEYSIYFLTKDQILEFYSIGNIDNETYFDCIINCFIKYDDNLSSMIESNFHLPIKICEKIKKTKNFKIFHFDSFYSKFFNLAPYNKYLLSKKNLLDWTNIFHNENPGYTTFILRLEHLIGSNESESKFNAWLIRELKSNNKIELSKSKHKLDFIYVNDLIDLIKILIEGNSFEGEYKILEVGSGINHSIEEFAEMIKSKLFSKSKILYTKKLELYKTQTSIAKNQNLIKLGWKPIQNFEEILDKIL